MTTIVRWNPVREMSAAQSAFDRFFEDRWSGVRGAEKRGIAVDVHETAGAYRIVAPLPGVAADGVNISLHEDVLTISAELPQFAAPEDARVLLLERSFGKVSRSLRLPQAVAADQIEAVLENGVLVLTLPKTPEAQPRVIPVRAANGLTHEPSKN